MSLATTRHPWVGSLLILAFLSGWVASNSRVVAADTPPPANQKVSYDKQVRPIFQAHCQGCHQPAKAGGGYVMTAFDRLLAGGESKDGGDRPGQAGREPPGRADHARRTARPRCPRTSRRSPTAEIELDPATGSRKGRVDDTPARRLRPRTTRTIPPSTRRPPVIARDRLLARRPARWPSAASTRSCSGRPTARSWSPGWSGSPSGSSRSGSRPTATGWPSPAACPAGWARSRSGTSPSGSSPSRSPSRSTRSTARAGRPTAPRSPSAAPTTRVRAIDAKTGEQVLFMGSHNDWVLDTVFSADGSHLISVGRDMTAKLTEVATQRFVDNITSITPGALKGGIAAVARHPKRDEIVVGGSDGMPKLYRVFRQTVRVIGDDSNLIREFAADAGPGLQRGRQRRRQADRRRQQPRRPGEVDVYSYEFDTGLPDSHQGDHGEGRHDAGAGRGSATRSTKYLKRGRQADRQGRAAQGRRLRRGLPARRQGARRRRRPTGSSG